jgi:hypothetical protein
MSVRPKVYAVDGGQNHGKWLIETGPDGMNDPRSVYLKVSHKEGEKAQGSSAVAYFFGNQRRVNEDFAVEDKPTVFEAVLTAQHVDDFLFGTFDNRPGNDGWAVTHGPPELLAWAKQTSPKVACGTLIRNPYSIIPDVNARDNGEEANEDGPGKLSHGFS